MNVTRTPLGLPARTFNFGVGAIGIALLVMLTIASPPGVPNLLLATTFLTLFVFARLMRFEIPDPDTTLRQQRWSLNITASLVVPLQIASILLLGPIVTAWLALPAFLVEVVRERALSGQSGARRWHIVSLISFNLGMEALMTLAGGACWKALGPPDGRLGASLYGHVALLATFVAFKLVNETLMVVGSWLRGVLVSRYIEGARRTVVIETLTLPMASLMVLIREGLNHTAFYLFVAGTLIAAILVRGLTRARAGLAAANSDLERRVREVETLARIGQAISADVELDSLLETIYRRCCDILVANHFFIALYTEGERRLQIPLEMIDGQAQPPQEIPLGEGLTSHVILSRAPLLVRDLLVERTSLPAAPILTDESPSRSWLGVPMVAKGETVGAIVLQEEEPRAYDEDDVRVLSAIAAQAAISVKNARLHREALHALRVEEENRQLKRLNAKKSEFVNMVAHQFRTPLTAVIGYADLLVQRVQRIGGVTVPDLERHLKTVHSESKRLATMVEELLNLSRIRSGRLPLTVQRFDLRQLAAETMISHQLLADGRRLSVVLAPGHAPVDVQGDSNFIRQAFANVLANALKYAPEGSRIDVRLRHDDDRAVLEVQDEGPGVGEDDLERVFDEFYRAAGSTADQPGTGLGLSICRGIIEAHGGTTWAERRGSGTAFCIALPLSACDVGEADAPATTAPSRAETS